MALNRVGVIDCGTNSIRLLIAEAINNKLHIIHREMKIAYLGQDVDANKEISSDALKRTKSILKYYAQIMTTASVNSIRMIATSAARDANNRKKLFTTLTPILSKVVKGSKVEVITGYEEAELSFFGVIDECKFFQKPLLIIDIGGGSMEVIFGNHNIQLSSSVKIGCVRIAERYLHSDPPSISEIKCAQIKINNSLIKAFRLIPLDLIFNCIGLAGTMTTISALVQLITNYNPNLIHLSRISFKNILIACERLISMTKSELKLLGPIHSGRTSTISGGLIILKELITLFENKTQIDEILISESDILNGIALSII